ncbi:hypothetical protein AAVH_27730 [Aphelenchoides avenae]|nr:hypothetical protein AAVH_27730 [Aphelenchus avenae]
MAGPAENSVAEDITNPKVGKCAGDGTFPLLIIVTLICVFCLQCLKMRQDDARRAQELMDEAERNFKAAIASRSRRGCKWCTACKCRRLGNFRTDEEILLERAKFYAEAFAKIEVTANEVTQQRYASETEVKFNKLTFNKVKRDKLGISHKRSEEAFCGTGHTDGAE